MTMKIIFSQKSILIWVLVVACLAGAQEQKPASGELTAADGFSRLQAKDNAGAAKILEEVTKREPQNERAWRYLGVAYENLKDWDRAIQSYQHALQVSPESPAALFNLGEVYAQKGDKDQAFAWL